MYISYSEPLSRGWERMKKALFQPFNFNKWINVGFTAFLAGLTDCNGGSSGNNSGYNNHNDWNDFFNFPQTAWDWLTDNPLWFNLIILGLILVFIIVTVLMWVSSRGKFMLLYNVARNEDEVRKPWHEFKKQGNSLFIWRFFFGWFAFFAFTAYFVYCFITVKNMFLGEVFEGKIVWMVAGLILVFLALVIFVGYVALFLDCFVVPIMYKFKIGATRGWLKFLSLFTKYMGSFIVFGLFMFVLGIGVAVAVIFFALVTCCIGLVFLAIPFVGTLILLPIIYTFRAFSIEFLAQFGEEYNVFPIYDESGLIAEQTN